MKKWLIIGLIAVAVVITARALYTLSGFSDLEVAEQQSAGNTAADIPAPAAVIPVPAELSEQASIQAKETKEVLLDPVAQDALTNLQIERGSPPGGRFSGRDPEGLGYAERIQREQEYEEIGRQRAEHRKYNPTRDDSASDN